MIILGNADTSNAMHIQNACDKHFLKNAYTMNVTVIQKNAYAPNVTII